MRKFCVYACSALTSLIWTLAPSAGTAQEQAGTRYAGEMFASRSAVLGRNGMAATSHPIASLVAVDVLKRGGSAVDAAIAANAMLALVEPMACGIGGDLFAIVWDPDVQELVGYNGSGRSPRGLSYAELRDVLDDRVRQGIVPPAFAEVIPPIGPMSVSVPGAVDGWYALHERYGRLPMADLLQPAIDYAREGIPITEVTAASWRRGLEAARRFEPQPEWIANFYSVYMPDGRLPETGGIFRNPDLADSYERLARDGRESFYGGETADRIVEAVAAFGGRLHAEDLASHQGEWVTPISVNYRGYDIYELPPNSQGLAVLQMLKILEAWPLADLGRDSADFWHLLIEAKKLAFEDRARYYADPEFGADDFEFLISDRYIAERRRLIDPDRAAQSFQAGGPPATGDTTYLAVGDDSGMMVSFIQSNYSGFGSRVVPEGLGFALQNRGSQFSLEQGHANVYAPGKRPFHTLIPGFVILDDMPIMAFGVMGAHMQPQGHVQVLVDIIDLGMSLQEAGDAARFRHDDSSQPTGQRMTDGGRVFMESGIPVEIVEDLQRRGHRVEHGARGGFGGYQAVWRDPETGVYRGASEMRFDGAALGY